MKTRYVVYALGTMGQVIGNNWTYNRDEVKSLVLYFKKCTFASGVMVNGKVWMF